MEVAATALALPATPPWAGRVSRGGRLMESDERTARYVQLLTDHQRGLFAYVVSLLGDVNESQNVLQETNMVLWRRSTDFVEGTDFGAWAEWR
jgi:DNA-directed RNA polymerase specialized sigma24 family protein